MVMHQNGIDQLGERSCMLLGKIPIYTIDLHERRFKSLI